VYHDPMRTTRRGFLTASLAAAAPVRAAGKLSAGAATADITPLLGCSLAGNMTDHIGTDVHDPLHVRAIVLDNGRARLAIAQVDSCAVPREIFDRAKQAIQAHADIPAEHVLLSATHTHTAPAAAHLFQSLPDPKYTEFLSARIADCVRLAVNRLQPARAGWTTGREERLVFNRRYFMKPGTIPADPFGHTTDRVQMNPPVGSPDIVKAAGPVDPEVGVLAVETADGRPLAVLGNYALHYVGGTGPGDISADYFAAWARIMERLAGAPVMASLSNACSGNINGVNFLGKPVRLPPYVQMERYAATLAAECYRAWRTIDFQDDLELRGAVEEVELGVRLPDAADLAAARRLLSEAGPGPYKERPHIYARETVLLAEKYPRTAKTLVQALRIGSLGIATYPGEAFVELGLELKAKSPFHPTFPIELANDYRGYIPTPEGHEQGGYETWRAKSSYLEKQAAPKLVAAALRALGRVA
jgi:neutral ceramidase